MNALGCTLAVVALLAAACGDEAVNSHTVVDSFDGCHRGLYFAECGESSGEPVFGCTPETEQCWWFTNGAVPSEVTAVSNCFGDDICCHDDWPFTPAVPEVGAYRLFHALDTLPWDRDREMHLQVVVDPALPAPATTTLLCNGAVLDEAGNNPCGNVEGVNAYLTDTPAIGIYAPSGFYGWNPILEIDESASGTLRARVCIHRYTDVVLSECPAATALCATSGEITVSEWPLPSEVDTAFRLDVTLADGSTLVADGTITSSYVSP